jgi:hypothetical protein
MSYQGVAWENRCTLHFQAYRGNDVKQDLHIRLVQVRQLAAAAAAAVRIGSNDPLLNATS